MGHRRGQFTVGVAGIAVGLSHRRTHGVNSRGHVPAGVEALLLDIAVGVGNGGLGHRAARTELICELVGAGAVSYSLCRDPAIAVIRVRYKSVAKRIDNFAKISV